MLSVAVWFVIVAVAIFLFLKCLVAVDWDRRDFLRRLVEARGCQLHEHIVTTVDGYHLEVHRIVSAKYDHSTPASYSATRTPVLIAPGLFCSSTDFLYTCRSVNERKCADSDSIVHRLLATDRYDVWVMNNRGNCFSDRHVKHAYDQAEYWRFSCDEMAKYDMPAVIDYVTDKTGHASLGFIGFSQGNLLMFALLSEAPEYAAKIRPFIAWAPAAFFGHLSSPIRHLIAIIPILRGLGGQFPLFRFSNWLGRTFRPTAVVQWVTRLLFRSTMGLTNFRRHNRLPVWLHLFPSTGSTWQYVQHLQWSKCGRFNKFDYGDRLQNIAHYGTFSPPDYPLAKIPSETVVVLMRAVTDTMTTDIDTDKLAHVLRHDTQLHTLIDWKVPVKVWNHLDFIMSVDASKLVYDRTLQYLDQFVSTK